MIIAVALYSSVTIPNLRILARMPFVAQQATLGGKLRKWLGQPMADPALDAQLLEPLDAAGKVEIISLVSAANNLSIAALVGILLFQGAQAYAQRQYERELKKFNEEQKAAKAR